MSPEAKTRIAWVVQQLYREGAATVKAGPKGEEALLRYAATILESVVEEEVQRRLAARDGG